jgi:hypothetical protein
MQKLSKDVIHDSCFLRLLLALNRWSGSSENQFQTASSQDLFYLIAEFLLDKTQAPKYQTLKFLNGRFTDRAMRQRIREFELLGLITTIRNPIDVRTKQLVPSDQFIALLNTHVRLQRQLCGQHMHLIDKVQHP